MRDFHYSPAPPFIPDPLAMTYVLRDLARCARRSPDPSTQNAAAAVADLRSPYPTFHAYHNGPPFVCDPAELTDRDYKIAVTVHAEERVCLKRVCLNGHAADLVALWAACPPCARKIVERGFLRVWTLDMPCPERWRESVALGREILARGGVQVITVTPKFELGETWLHNGQEFRL